MKSRLGSSALYIPAALFVFLGFRGNASHSTLVFLCVLAYLVLSSFPSFRAELKRAYASQVGALKTRRSLKAAFFLAGVPMILVGLVNGRTLSSLDNSSMQTTAAQIALGNGPDLTSVLSARLGKSIDCDTRHDYYVVCTPHGNFAGTSPGMLAITVPVFFAARVLGADLSSETATWRLAKWTASWIAGIILALFLCLALHVTSLKAATGATVFLGLGSNLWSITSQGLWSHGGVCLALMTAIYLLFIPSKRSFFLGTGIGLAWAMMFATRMTAAPLIVIFFFWVAFSKRKLLPGAAIGAISGLIPFLVYCWMVYGHPLGPQFLGAASSPRTVFSATYFPIAFSGLLISPGTGFLVYQPWAWLLLLWKRGRTKFPDAPRAWVPFSALMVFSQLFFYAFFIDWHGQWCWGTRYLTDITPLIALLVAPILGAHGKHKAFRRAALALGALAFLIQLNGVLLNGDDWSWNPPPGSGNDVSQRVWDWSDAAFIYPLPRLLSP